MGVQKRAGTHFPGPPDHGRRLKHDRGEGTGKVMVTGITITKIGPKVVEKAGLCLNLHRKNVFRTFADLKRKFRSN